MESIYKTCGKLSCQVYLVDNASTRPMPDAFRRYIFTEEEGRKIQFLQAKRNRGYAAGNNIGLKKALEDGCSVIIVSNNDIIFREQAVQKMADCLEAHPRIGIAAPKVVDAGNHVQPSYCLRRTGIKEIFQFYTAAKWFFRKRQDYYCLGKNPGLSMDVYHVSGCCFALSRECAQKVVPLDEETVLYYEELILGIRMERAGYRTRYEPGSVVVHQHGATARLARPFMYQCISQSELYYCARYLHARKWQLYLLYRYRRLLYFLRSLTDRKMRSYQKTFRKQTKLFYQEYTRQNAAWKSCKTI